MRGAFVQVLAGVEQVDDLGGFGELDGGDVPDPGGAVADDGELADVIGAAAGAFGFHQVREDSGGLERRDVAGRARIADRVALVIELVLGEEHAELDLAGAGAAVFALAATDASLGKAIPARAT